MSFWKKLFGGSPAPAAQPPQPKPQQTKPMKEECDSCGKLEANLSPLTLDSPKGRKDILVCGDCLMKAIVGGLESGNLHFE